MLLVALVLAVGFNTGSDALFAEEGYKILGYVFVGIAVVSEKGLVFVGIVGVLRAIDWKRHK